MKKSPATDNVYEININTGMIKKCNVIAHTIFRDKHVYEIENFGVCVFNNSQCNKGNSVLCNRITSLKDIRKNLLKTAIRYINTQIEYNKTELLRQEKRLEEIKKNEEISILFINTEKELLANILKPMLLKNMKI